MYICNSCGEVFDEPDRIEEHHPYGMTTATETWDVCPCCGDNDISEAKQCSRCAEYVAELHDGMCEICYDDING